MKTNLNQFCSRKITQCAIILTALLLFPLPAIAWKYSENMDKMRGTVWRFATTESKNTVPFGGGFQLRVVLGIRKFGNNESDAYLHLITTPGAFGCMKRCRLNIKFDNDPITEIYVTSSNNLNTMFIESSDTLIEKLKRSKNLIVEADFVSSGTHQLEFNVDGLSWPQ